MKKLIFIAALLLAGCTDPQTASRVLVENGYTDIHLGGYNPWSCSKGDTYATNFDAISPTGQRVTGVVCNGWLKGATIRFTY